MAAKKKSAAFAMSACHDRQRRTCIQVHRDADVVKYIPLDIVTGLEVHTTSVDSFDQRFTPMEGYPVEKACRLYLSYAQNIGASKEALDYLGQIINISKQESDMATKKKAVVAEKTTPTKKVAKPAPGRAMSATKAVPTKKVGAKAVKPAKTGEKKPSAAQMFQDLIMAGNMTDDQIFEEVQAEFGLDEKKRGYVKWYRNHLTKLGMKPPAAK
jgi:hypothetical protein